MTRGILARKMGMTQLFTDEGTVVSVTVLQSGDCKVVQSKTVATDGYDAVQLAADERATEKNVPKPLAGHYKAAGLKTHRVLRELRGAVGTPGEKISVGIFAPGEKVDIIGVSKGKGFAGQHKRHNFSRGPVSHGSNNIRQAGSIGSVDAARTFKGVRMAGHLGAHRTTVRNLQIVRVDVERNLILVEGAVPGARNDVVMVRASQGGGF